MRLDIKKSDFHFDRFNTFVIVGCGGTGSWFVPMFLKAVAPQLMENDQILLIDPDIVEERNVTRQNFIREDIGKNKAEVLGLRYGMAYGILDHIVIVPTKFSQEGRSGTILKGYNNYVIILGFVDNSAARSSIISYFRHNFRGVQGVYVDSGNESKSGQIYVGIRKDRRYLQSPELFEVFPDMETVPLKKANSCVDEEQNIYINTLAANMTFQVARELVFERGIKNILTFFNIQKAVRQLDIIAVRELIKVRNDETKQENINDTNVAEAAETTPTEI